MDPLASRAAVVLADHPSPALRLSALLDLLTRDHASLRLDASGLRSVLERYPQTFRLLDPWRGPWRHTRTRMPDELGSGEPWVVVVSDPGGADVPVRPGIAKLRESVRWLARGADARSSREVTRAHGMVVGEREVRDALRRAA